MKKNKEESCKTCRYCEDEICHRYPPQAFAGEDGNYWGWPKTDPEDSCGEWKKD